LSKVGAHWTAKRTKMTSFCPFGRPKILVSDETDLVRLNYTKFTGLKVFSRVVVLDKFLFQLTLNI
jgi:hypothetical protein